MGIGNDCMVGSRTRTPKGWDHRSAEPVPDREACAVVMRPKVGNEYNKAEALNLMAYMAIILQIEPREFEAAIEEAIG